MALLDDFKARFPEFDETVVDQRLPGLADVWPSYYGGDYADDKEIVLQLVAHLLTVDTQRGAAPAQTVTSRGGDGVSVSYAAVQPTTNLAEFFSSTKYGQRFMLLTARGRGGVFV